MRKKTYPAQLGFVYNTMDLYITQWERKAENPSSRKFDNNFFVIFIENEWTKKT